MFELFAETIDRIPPKATLNFLKREYETLQDALRHQRIKETPEIHSIMCFCQFMNPVAGADTVFAAVDLPVEHTVYYRKIVERLIAAGEIPEAAKAQFDAAISAGFRRRLANN